MLHIGGKFVLKLKRVMLRLCCVDWNIVTEFWRHCAPLKCCLLFTSLHGVTSQKNCNFSKTAMRTSTTRTEIMFLLVKPYGRQDKIYIYIYIYFFLCTLEVFATRKALYVMMGEVLLACIDEMNTI